MNKISGLRSLSFVFMTLLCSGIFEPLAYAVDPQPFLSESAIIPPHLRRLLPGINPEIPSSCPLYKVNINLLLLAGGGIGRFLNGSSAPQCLHDEIMKGLLSCGNTGVNTDDCLAGYLTSDPWLTAGNEFQSSGWTPLGFTYSDCTGYYNNYAYSIATNNAAAAYFWGIYYNNCITQTVSIYLDPECNSVSDISPDEISQACDAGTLQWIGSPISLIWDETADVNQQVTTVKFPVDPRRDGQWQLWKASKVTPLLVFDPSHQGKITTAAQLFGNWTFGGKQLVMLQSQLDDNSNIGGAPWQNGFEALGTLDANNDQQLSDKELEPLGLWFDNNQDGISQIGEVKTLNTLGVTTLFYTPDQQNQETNDLIASLGFLRTLDGKTIRGKLVDWYSDAAENRAELIGKHLAKSPLCNNSESKIIPDLTKFGPFTNSNKTAESQIVGKSAGRSLVGAWSWRATGDTKGAEGEIPQGYLTFKDEGGDKLSGHSYVEMRFLDSFKAAKRMVNIYTLMGSNEVNKKGETKILFKIETKEGTSIESEAELSSNGKWLLNGISRATVSYGDTPVTITYKWEAKKVY